MSQIVNAQNCEIDYKNERVIVDDIVVPFIQLSGYSYTHSYTWSNAHPQDPEAREHDAKDREDMNVFGDCKELSKGYRDGGIEESTGDNGYIYEVWNHSWALDLRYLNDGRMQSIHFCGLGAIEARRVLKSVIKDLKNQK